MINKKCAIMCFLATQKGAEMLLVSIRAGYVHEIGCVVTFKELIAESYEKEILRLCLENNIPFYWWGTIKDSIDNLIEKHGITGIVAAGWKYMIPLSLNDYLRYPIIVFHDSLLPKYRGFAPTPTAIMVGDNNIGVTALYAANDVDRGEIIWQKETPIDSDLSIKEVISVQSKAYGEGFMFLLERMKEGIELSSVAQDEGLATYSIWRSPDDCKIDWSKTAQEIHNFVRALGSPYSGAFTTYKDKIVRVLRTTIVPDLQFVIRDYGKIWGKDENGPLVICGEGMIQINSAVFEDGKSVDFDTIRYRLN